MHTTAFKELLVHLHTSIDRVADELAPDRPELAHALRARARRLPRPEDARLLLYDTLAAGLFDAQQFDQLMLRQNRAARAERRGAP
jgi:hypothetical protein